VRPVAELAALQRAFFERVTARAAPVGPADGEPGGLVASGDLGIYATMYASRLSDALAEDYPKLRAALGDAGFAAVVAAYLRVHPPRSFTLRDAGLALPEYLRTGAGAPAWAADLAALERARVEVFDGPEARPLGQDEVVALDTELPALVLRWVPSSVVVPIAWTVDELWSALEDGEPRVEPVAAARVVLAWRRDVAVLHRTLDPDEGELAGELVPGTRFADLCERLGALHGDAAGARAAELLLRWLAAEAVVAGAPDPTAAY
jgi:hypothetical protein